MNTFQTHAILLTSQKKAGTLLVLARIDYNTKVINPNENAIMKINSCKEFAHKIDHSQPKHYNLRPRRLQPSRDDCAVRKVKTTCSSRHTPFLESAMGCHANHAFSHISNRLNFEDGLISHLGGPNEQFGTHERLSVDVW